MDWDGIINTDKEAKSTKSKVNKDIKYVESEDFDQEKLAKMSYNDAQKVLKRKHTTSDRALRRAKAIGKQQDASNESCAPT